MHIAVCLDLTRLVSRVGRPALTGIDRVEGAYLDWALARPDSRFLVRTSRGHLLLGSAGARALHALLHGRAKLPRPDMLCRVIRRGTDPRRAAEAALRPLALSRAPRGMQARLGRWMDGRVYLNTGHSNLRHDTLTPIARRAPVWVFVHDTIPLDLPGMTRPEMVARFRTMLAATARSAAGLIVNSAHTARRVQHHWPGPGPRPPVVMAPLGVAVRPRPDAPPVARPDVPPAFVAVGTLEARKNHALLLDVWEALAQALPPAAMPHLHLVGTRGWRNEAFLRRLDTSPLAGRVVHEHGALEDARRDALLAGARALLFPSFEEGFGLPPAEAAAMGVLPICSDLPVLRETLGDAAVYLSPHAPYQWIEIVRQCLDGRLGPERTAGFAAPTWSGHFRRVEDGLKTRQDGWPGRA